MTGQKMGFNATWAMAVGGMIGGGIFSVLGVVTSVAGPLFPVSFLIGGAIALATAWSYSHLVARFGEGGGAFTFLRHEQLPRIAGALSWVLILGYTLTISVYAYTFSAYLSEALGLGGVLPSVAAVSVIAGLVAINLVGVRQAAGVEVVAVWGKVVILAALGVAGLARWDVSALSEGAHGTGLLGAAIGASAVFMAYEGFQLLAYDYDDIAEPDKTLRKALLTAVASVLVIYIVVSLEAVMLTGIPTLVRHKEVALAIAGERAAGAVGKWTVTLAAVLSTASAINATLFATARLAERVSRAGELPSRLGSENRRGIPSASVIALGSLAAVLSVVGGLSRLVETASLTFLFTFAAVNALAYRELGRGRWISLGGAIGAAAAAIVLSLRIFDTAPWSLFGLGMVIAAAFAIRPLMTRQRGDRAPTGTGVS